MVPVNREVNLRENPKTERAVGSERENMANLRRNMRREMEPEH